MPNLYAGLDVSDTTTAVCVVDASGATIHQTSVSTTPVAIARVLAPYRAAIASVGFETGIKATWLYKELKKRRFPVVCLDALRTHAALSAQRNKTDKIDAHGIAMLLSSGRFTAAYIKADDAVRARLLLAHRRVLVRKAGDLDRALRTSLKEFGASLTRKNGRTVIQLTNRKRDLFLSRMSQAMLRASAALRTEIDALDLEVARMVRTDAVCCRLMTAPGVGPLTALTFKAGVDDPFRFRLSRTVGAYFGLTPRRHQSGRTDFSHGISRRGDGSVRAVLYEAAFSLLHNCKTKCALKIWAVNLKERKGSRAATVALARRLAVVLHRMWVTERDFDPTAA
jgi:transposase